MPLTRRASNVAMETEFVEFRFGSDTGNEETAMKTQSIVKRIFQVTLLGAALATPAMAQMGPGMGGGWGMGPGGGPRMQGCVAAQGGAGAGCMRGMGAGRVAGMGQGMGRGMGRGMAAGMGPGRGTMGGAAGTPGRALMTPEEQTAQQAKMRAVKSYDECKLVRTEHRTLMEKRAKEKGVALFAPRGNPCDNLKARGLIQ